MIKMYEIKLNFYISDCEINQLMWSESLATMEYVVAIGREEILRIDICDFDVWYRDYGFQFEELIK